MVNSVIWDMLYYSNQVHMPLMFKLGSIHKYWVLEDFRVRQNFKVYKVRQLQVVKTQVHSKISGEVQKMCGLSHQVVPWCGQFLRLLRWEESQFRVIWIYSRLLIMDKQLILVEDGCQTPMFKELLVQDPNNNGLVEITILKSGLHH